MALVRRERSGVVWMEDSSLGARNCFTTRYGGVSSGYLESLNLGENRGDEQSNVFKNYELLGTATGIDTVHMAYTKQIHGNEVRIVSSSDCRTPFTPFKYDADGIVTSEHGLTLIAYTADCIPLLMCDPDNGVIAAVHCGWRSTVADIAGIAIDKMCLLGASAENIRAAIGPGISVCCFETGSEIPEAIDDFLGSAGAQFYFEKPGAIGKFMVDLKGANRYRLIQKRLSPSHITVSDECTCCRSEKYWSHRATNGVRGCQASLITL